MIENFFQRLEADGVAYLLISGQATVLYGAATFSEDIDLWLNPTSMNADRFLAVLRSCGARYYKLTPPLEVEWLERGHGFHFVLPESNGPDIYLDVMGKPPRVPAFAEAVKSAQWMEDYPIIGRLALAWLDRLNRAPAAEDYQWVLEQLFTLPELQRLLEAYPDVITSLPDTAPASLRAYAQQWSCGATDGVESEVSTYLQGRISGFQQTDRRHWRTIIGELKELREQGRLLPEGAPV